MKWPPLQFDVLKRWLPLIISVAVLLIAALALQIDWSWKRKLSPCGGRYFFHRVELAVPSFRQADEKWSDDPLGGVEANGTLGGEGCAVAAAAMVFKFYGIDTDPQQLNWFLTSVGGYTEQGWIYWDRAAWLAPERVRHAYEDLGSYRLIDSNLVHGNPVIVRVRLPSGITHFSSSPGKMGLTTSCKIRAAALPKVCIRCANLAATSKRYDFISRSRMGIRHWPHSGERSATISAPTSIRGCADNQRDRVSR